MTGKRPAVAGDDRIRPFRIEVPQADLDDLHTRLKRTRWTDAAEGQDYGVSLDVVRRLVDYWCTDYDWRSWEARLNAYPQFTTAIDGQNVHFLHIRSPEPDALPLLCSHGWPGSIVEFLDVINALSDPRAHGGDPADAFHLVIPSLPGFGFSGPTTRPGWGTRRIARAWAELMPRLGYQRYGAHGNDAGSMISPEVGRLAGDQVVGVHVTQIFSFPSGDPTEFADMSVEDMGQLQKLQWFLDNKFSFNHLHSQQPQTLAHALADSPAGLLGWNSQLMAGDAMDQPVDEDFILTNTAIYWFTNTGGSSIRFYYADAHDRTIAEPTTVPIGLATFRGDFGGIRRFAERDHKNIVQWHTYDTPAGHYAAHLASRELIDDIRGFFRPLR